MSLSPALDLPPPPHPLVQHLVWKIEGDEIMNTYSVHVMILRMYVCADMLPPDENESMAYLVDCSAF